MQSSQYDDLFTAEGNSLENKDYYKKRIEELNVTDSYIKIPIDVKLI